MEKINKQKSCKKRNVRVKYPKFDIVKKCLIEEYRDTLGFSLVISNFNALKEFINKESEEEEFQRIDSRDKTEKRRKYPDKLDDKTIKRFFGMVKDEAVSVDVSTLTILVRALNLGYMDWPDFYRKRSNDYRISELYDPDHPLRTEDGYRIDGWYPYNYMLLEELGDNKYRVAGGNAKSAKIGQILEFSKIELQYAYHIDEEYFLQEDGTMSTRVIGGYRRIPDLRLIK